MDREQINKIHSDYLNDCETEHDMEQIFDLALQAQADEDAISRRAAIDANCYNCSIKANGGKCSKCDAVKAIEKLPPVKPQQEDIAKDGTLTVRVADGRKVSRVLVCGDNHWGGLYYLDENAQSKAGHWIDADGDNAICVCCNRLNHLYGTYCKHCGARMIEP